MIGETYSQVRKINGKYKSGRRRTREQREVCKRQSTIDRKIGTRDL